MIMTHESRNNYKEFASIGATTLGTTLRTYVTCKSAGEDFFCVESVVFLHHQIPRQFLCAAISASSV
jgi:hypothetical protein